jgi:L-malate glycosyltransferase
VSGERFRVGAVGRLVPVKDPDLFLDVAEAVARVRDDVTFEFIGDGPLRSSFEHACRARGLDSIVRVLGHRSDASRLVGEFDLLLFTSRSEGIPYALLEAMAAGVPTVAPRVGGLPEVLVDGESALFSEERSAASLAGKIDQVLSRGDLRERLSKGALERASGEFAATTMLARLLAVYESARG